MSIFTPHVPRPRPLFDLYRALALGLRVGAAVAAVTFGITFGAMLGIRAGFQLFPAARRALAAPPPTALATATETTGALPELEMPPCP